MSNAWLELPGFEEAVARVVENVDRADDGFLDADGAAAYLGITRKAVYTLVERRRLPYADPQGGCSSTGASFVPGWSVGDERPHTQTCQARGSEQAETDEQTAGRRGNAPGPDTED